MIKILSNTKNEQNSTPLKLLVLVNYTRDNVVQYDECIISNTNVVGGYELH